MIGNQIVQAGIIAKLKANTDLLAVMVGVQAGATVENIKEDQYQGRTFTYPAVRVDIQRQEPMNEKDQCDPAALFFTVRCYAQANSSQDADKLAEAVNNVLHKQQVDHTSADGSYRIPRARSAGLAGAIRVSENLWMTSAAFTGNVNEIT